MPGIRAEPGTLLVYLERCEKRGNLPAFFHKFETHETALSFAEFFQTARKAAEYFKSLGLGKGDKVIFWGPNSPVWVSAFMGCLLKGIIAVPIDFRLGAGFVERIFYFTQAKFVLCDAEKKAVSVPSITFPEFSDGIKQQSLQGNAQERIYSSDPAAVFFTSGTTSEPKGAVLTHENIYSAVESLHAAARGLGRREHWLSLLPLSHIFEQVVGFWLPLKRGDAVIYLKELKPALLLEALEKGEVTLACVVPRVLRLLRAGILKEAGQGKKRRVFDILRRLAAFLPSSRARRRLFPSLARKFGKSKYFLAGGSTLDKELESFWESVGIPILQGYGLTETSALVSCNGLHQRRFGSIGKVLPGVEIRLKDREILVKGRNVFGGYFQNEERTREVFEGEWFKTGDLGEFDEDGFLYFRGRCKDVIVAGEGINVYPEDIEPVLNNIEGVRDSCVLGIREGKGETVHAVLILENDSYGPREIMGIANRKMERARKIINASVWPEADFPRTTTMKIKRKEVLHFLYEHNLISEPVQKAA